MAIQFILGRSGSGKTNYCIKAIVNELLRQSDNQSLLLLVPEQATYQAERAILGDKRISGYHRLHVLSFDRLQFLLLGKNTARPAVSRIGQQMIIHRILRENQSKMKLFHPSANWTGLARKIADTITELHQYAKTPDDIEQFLSELQKDQHNSLTALKFADIKLILQEYLNFIEGKFIDPDFQLTQACRAVANADFIKGAKLWVDGFASFTTSELAILTEILKIVAEAQIALCFDPSKINLENPHFEQPDPTSIFYPTQRTYVELLERIKKCKLKFAKPTILNQPLRFASCPQLAHIEKNIFSSKTDKICSENNIRIISAPNAQAEVQFVARQILQLVKEKGYRYRDIAVIASDLDSYEHYIGAYFEDYAIPFFLDKRKPLNQHPAAELIRSALQVITSNFTHGDIFAYLKTDLVPITRSEVDLLENYCLAFGINSGDWQSDSDWNFAAEDDQTFDEQRINQIRRKAINALLELRDALCPADNPKLIEPNEFTCAIFAFLDRLQIRQTLAKWIEQATEQKDYAAVEEHQQLYDKLINIFDELCEVFASRQLSCQDYLAIFDSAFSQLTLAFIPPTLDQVLVGSIERSRHPDLKAVFLIGATQRQFPVPVIFDTILTEDDRQIAESANFQLAPAASQVLTERQYLAYIAFTRPSEFLCITYPAVNDKGTALIRSQFIDNLEALFEDLTEEQIPADQIDIHNIHSEIELADLLCARLGKDVSRDSLENSGKQVGGLLGEICSDEQLAELGSNVVYAINYDNRALLDKDVVKQLFSRQIRTSATKLGTFAACPYQYFARYILELQERAEFKLEPLDVGIFYHQVLNAFLKRLNAENKDWATTKDNELLELLNNEIVKIVQTHPFISNFRSRSPHNAFIINSASDTLEDYILSIARMVRAGDFRPSMSEVSFGQPRNAGDTLGECKIKLGFDFAHHLPDNRTLFLDGKIDRIDIANIDGQNVAIIFDYKRSEYGAKFNWSEFYYGLDMQLPIYMLAVCNLSQAAIAGAFYMPIEVQPKQAALPEPLEQVEKFRYKANGLFNGDFAQYLDRDASKDSKFYNFYVTKDGEPYGIYESRGALKPDDFEKILKFAERKIAQLAKDIICGKIDVSPYRLNQDSPCRFCKYKPVCRFDWQINDYNFLESLNKTWVLEKIGQTNGAKKD